MKRASLTMFALVVVAVAVSARLVTAQDHEAEARVALDEYFRSWNAADNEDIARISNFPRVSVGPSGQIVVRETPEEIVTDFDALRDAQGWDYSSLDLVDAVHVSEGKVHFRIVFSRRHADGAPYSTVPALYVITKQNGHWGLQLQSLMPPTFTAP
jgi:hypothetical protein